MPTNPSGSAGAMESRDRRVSDVTITAILSDVEAQAFAQFLKRACFGDYEQHAVSQAEAYTMIAAGERIREALKEQGYAPR